MIIPENTRKRITWIDLSEEDPKPKLFGQVTGWGPVQSIYRRNIFEFRRLLQSITIDIKSMNRKFCADTVNKQFPSDQKLFCAYNINNAVHFPLVNTKRFTKNKCSILLYIILYKLMIYKK